MRTRACVVLNVLEDHVFVPVGNQVMVRKCGFQMYFTCSISAMRCMTPYFDPMWPAYFTRFSEPHMSFQ